MLRDKFHSIEACGNLVAEGFDAQLVPLVGFEIDACFGECVTWGLAFDFRGVLANFKALGTDDNAPHMFLRVAAHEKRFSGIEEKFAFPDQIHLSCGEVQHRDVVFIGNVRDFKGAFGRLPFSFACGPFRAEGLFEVGLGDNLLCGTEQKGFARGERLGERKQKANGGEN